MGIIYGDLNGDFIWDICTGILQGNLIWDYFCMGTINWGFTWGF